MALVHCFTNEKETKNTALLTAISETERDHCRHRIGSVTQVPLLLRHDFKWYGTPSAGDA